MVHADFLYFYYIYGVGIGNYLWEQLFFLIVSSNCGQSSSASQKGYK